MNEHACRITREYSALIGDAGLIPDWLKVSGKLLVYQHPADEEVKKTHCHFLIEECSIGQEGLKKRVKHYQFNGNSDWSFSQKEYDGNVEKYIIYMTKGYLDPVYNVGYCPLYLEECKKKWVSHPCRRKDDELNPENAYMVKPLKDAKETALIQQWLDYKKECLPTGNFSHHLELKDFRGVSISYWRKRNKGLMPTASTYKRFLVSLYLEYCDLVKKPLTEQVIDEVDERM